MSFKLENLTKSKLIQFIKDLVSKYKGACEEIDRLKKRIEELEREKNRQAAPFRLQDKKRKANPAKSGREPGHPGKFRTFDGQIDETIEVPLEECPHCKGTVFNKNEIQQIIEEIPEIKKVVYKVITYNGKCKKCGLVSSTHPLQTSTATGAAKVQLGPVAKSYAVALQSQYGLPKRKVCRILENFYQIKLTPGGLVHATHRAGEKMNHLYQEILTGLKSSAVIHSDETSWYVGKPNHWLWVFANKDTTAYKVSNSRGRDVLISIIGKNYQGTLVSDCLIVYDDVNKSQHKCYSHHLKAISEAFEKTTDADEKKYLNQLKLLLKTAIAVKAAKPDKPPDVYDRWCKHLEEEADRLILPEQTGIAEKVANRLRKQRDHLFTFLYKDGVDATNNLAERQLRPAVIARKVSCGNRTAKGAETWEILASLAATSTQRQQNFVDLVHRSIVLNPKR
jgi:transposase